MSNLDLKIEEIEELKNRSKNLQIITYGKYNHGKSSLLNALTNKEGRFKYADKRETIEIQNFEEFGINWIDTPGLDADIEEKDDYKANEMLKKSDIILFVHNFKEGEFDNLELNFLKDNKEKYIFIILTNLEEYSKTVLNKITQQLVLNNINFEIFQTSSVREFHKNEQIRLRSGIKELKNVIIENKQYLLDSRQSYINRISNDIIILIDSKLEKLENKKSEIYNKIYNLNNKFIKEKNKVIKKHKEYKNAYYN
jgi:GTPase